MKQILILILALCLLSFFIHRNVTKRIATLNSINARNDNNDTTLVMNVIEDDPCIGFKESAVNKSGSNNVCIGFEEGASFYESKSKLLQCLEFRNKQFQK